METTEGHLLGGNVRYAQPRTGFRSGIEPVLLAASIPAHAGERVIEAGSGAGAALLCLAARLPGVAGLGVERDPALAALARHNAAANGFAALDFVATDIAALPADAGPFDHAFANPPYHAEVGTASPIAQRDMAKRAHAGLFEVWTARLGALLRPRGTLSLIVPAAALPACLAALEAAHCRPAWVLPLWPKPGRAAKLVLLRGIKGGRGQLCLLPGLVLHTPEGGFTDAAEAILRRGAALDG
jgi:tRNA1Val (adenine37-N6)-methyltransferase